MPRTRSVTVDRDGLMTLEYVRSRRVLRLVGTADDQAGLRELPLPALFHELGIDPGELAPPLQFLLFAGSGGRALGGLADLVAVYQDEVPAREAFHRLRTTDGNREGWAELAALSSAGRMDAVCWFGRPRSVARTTPLLLDEAGGAERKQRIRTWRLRRRAPAQAAVASR
jgi:hypothetical protein